MSGLRRCARYMADGTKCGEVTKAVDGWCRKCDGFIRPDGEVGTRSPAPFRFNEEVPLPQVPIDPEDAATVLIGRAAISQFVARHGGHPREAEAQIRTLLEDMLLGAGRATRSTGGEWAINTTGKAWGYSLLLSPAGDVVHRYSTKHAERTYAQVRQGVATRVGTRKSKPKHEAWLLAGDVVWERISDEEAEERLIAFDPAGRESFEQYVARFRLKREQQEHAEPLPDPAP